MPAELVELANDSLPLILLDTPESEPVEVVETQRKSSGHAPIAGVGDVEGDGDSRRKEGCSLIFGVAMLKDVVVFLADYAFNPGVCRLADCET